MTLQEIEFQYPPFKFIKEVNSATSKSYFKNNSKQINNVAIKTDTKSAKIYQIDSISILPGSALRQNGEHTYLVVRNTGNKNPSDVVYLCFKLESGHEGSLDVFNNKVGVKRIDIDGAITGSPSSTVRINADGTVIILDCIVNIGQIPLVSKYHNIIETSEALTFNTKKISRVKRVITTASCTNTLSNVMPEKQKKIIHATMMTLTFLLAVGAWIGKGIIPQPLTNNSLLGIWVLLVIIIAPMSQNISTIEMAQTALVVKYFVVNIIIFAGFFNWPYLSTINWKTTLTLSYLSNLVKSEWKRIIPAIVGTSYTIMLFST